ncbi:unnamed protein product [Urochloa decumbens]|uniref:DUF7595 domain-containing protein n=1 Tax=Urochloa decumbens TaxID=240449 RepID=A0ABC9FYY2_9POAL
MAAGGDVVVVPSSREQAARGGRRRRRQTAACLPLDVVAAIAARSDAATLVRCAATCKDARRRIADDPGFLGRLRLRHTDRFLLPLLHGHLTSIRKEYGGSQLFMVDTTAPDANITRLTKVSFGSGPPGKLEPLDSRDGLILVCTGEWPHRELRVCSPATGRSQTLPPEPPSSPRYGTYVLLVGDGDSSSEVGRPFQVLKAKLVLSSYSRSERRLLIRTFSSEQGAWSPRTENIPTPNLHGDNRWSSLHRRPLVVGNVVHWLCLTDSWNYVLMLHVGPAASRVNVTMLPVCFPWDEKAGYLLATTSAGGNPVVLVADGERISAWEQSKHTKIWKQQPEVVIENEAILGTGNVAEWVEDDLRRQSTKFDHAKLEWFAERSGAVLIRISTYGLLWLDLRSKKIIRCFSDPRIQYSTTYYCPYEVDFKSWAPTFNCTTTF